MLMGASQASSTATRICRCIKGMLSNARRSLGGNATITDTDTSRTSTTSTTRSTIRRRRKLRLHCRSENWMAVLQRATGKPVGSVFIFNIAVARLTMANELELNGIPHHRINGGGFGFLERIPANRRSV